MRKALAAFLGLTLSSLGLAGCGTLSIPRVAAQGTTIVFPVPDGFAAGFGRALNQELPYGVVDPAMLEVDYASNPLLEDLQRGELLFALRAGATVESPLVTYLPVRFITRVHVDEASGATLPAAGEIFYNLGTPLVYGQTVAFVDIPTLTNPNTYYVFMERWRRDPDSPSHFEKLAPVPLWDPFPWLSWADSSMRPDLGMQIHVVASTHGSAFHDAGQGFDKWSAGQNYNVNNYTEILDHVVPHPKLRVWIGDPSTGELPAASEFTLAYPAGKIEITGATLARLHRSAGFVNLSVTTGSSTPCDAPGTARISLVDPDRTVQLVEVVYRLRNFEDCGRAEPGEFFVVTGSPKAYDIDGNPIDAFAYVDPDYSF